MPTVLDAYTFHGLSFKLEGENARAECPLCGKADHFFVHTKTGQFNCRRCMSEGNIYGFLSELWAASIRQRATSKRLVTLSEDRGIPLDEFRRWGLTESLFRDAFLLPIYNAKGALSNLARIVQVKERWQILGTPTCKLHPFGINLLQKDHKTLWICEGPWDAMKLSAALRTVRHNGKLWVNHSGNLSAINTHATIAVPGAGTFQPEWLTLFAGRDVRLCYDNDHPEKGPSGKTIQPGWQGMQRVAKIANEEGHKATRLSQLVWGKGGFNPELASGYDIRDLFNECEAADALRYVEGLLRTPKTKEATAKKVESSIEAVPCSSFDSLCETFAANFHFTQSMRQTLAVAIATVASTPFPGEQLFFRVIGPPGSGKTTIAECLSVAREYCFPKSILTGFHSGFTGGTGGAKKESSLIPEMNGKCVIIKDADTLLNAANKDKILSELRDIYDGSSRSHYRNKKQSDYEDLRNSFLLCGTDALRGLNRSFLGERFLDIDILGDSNTEEFLDSAINSAFDNFGPATGGKTIQSPEVKARTYGFLQHVVNRIIENKVTFPEKTERVKEQIKSLAILLSYCRARVERDRDEILYRPRAELATRLVKQFVKLVNLLAIILDKPQIDKEIMSILRKVTRDTAHGFPFEIVQHLYGTPQGCSSASLSIGLGLSDSTIRRLMADMIELGVIERRQESNRSGVGGRHTHLFVLSREVRDLYKTSFL